MIKIIQAINAMVSNPQKITKVIASPYPANRGTFFLYDEKYKWSILFDEEGNEYHLTYYRGSNTIEHMASFTTSVWPGSTDSVSYSSEGLKSREAFESLRALFGVVKEKLCGMDDVLNDIVKDDDLPY